MILICDLLVSSFFLRRLLTPKIMYVCLCQAVTDSQIRRAVDNGAHSLKAVREQTGVASCCGKCGKQAKEIVQAAVSEKRHDTYIKPLVAALVPAQAA